ncbi:MAG: class I SAM-dependent methyltransferase [Lachnospiraceae bacterium]|nr:class I SAM-dependent methyltransferase [Lachnospiraceae bacterium]
MIRTEDVRDFFDRLAPHWDSELVRNEEVIRLILDNAGVTAGKAVLDVATGTGVLIPDYLARGVSSVTAIDLSPEMARIAAEKFPQPEVTVLCGDAEATDFGKKFDCIMVYNAFPHFPDPVRLIGVLAGLLAPGGTLTVAHGASRETIDAHHSGSARHVSLGLMPAEELKAIFEQFLTVTALISDERMYQVVGKKL